MADSRYYIVKGSDAAYPTKRLVKATSQAEARRHVTHPLFTVELASPTDIVDLMSAGIVPEVAGSPSTASTDTD